MNKRLVLTVLGLAAVVVAAPASADIAYFPNPTGSGHFDWGEISGNPFNWLDITQDAASQPAAPPSLVASTSALSRTARGQTSVRRAVRATCSRAGLSTRICCLHWQMATL